MAMVRASLRYTISGITPKTHFNNLPHFFFLFFFQTTVKEILEYI